jgi:hypothetical protein
VNKFFNHDYFAVAGGTVGTWATLANVNTIIGTISGVITLAILAKKARREYKAKSNKP